MTKLRLKKTSDGHIHSWSSDGFCKVDDLITEITGLIFYKHLHPTTVLLTDHCTTKQSQEFCGKIRELESKLKIPIKTQPAVEMSLRYDDVFFHLIATVNGKDPWSKVSELEDTLLRTQRDAYLRKPDVYIEKVREYFKSHLIISRNKRYQLTRQKVIRTAGESFIEGGPADTHSRIYHFNGEEFIDGQFRKGVSFSHVVKTLEHLNHLMLLDGAISKPTEGYGSRSEIERYFNQGGVFYVSNKQFLQSLPDIQDCFKEIAELTTTRIFPHPAKYENWRELAEELKFRFQLLEHLEAYNPKYLEQIPDLLEHAKKLQIKTTSGSDFHGGDFHEDQKIGYLTQDKPLPHFSLS